VTACRDAERTIAETLDSVISQLDGVAGHVVVDGHSADGTLDIVRGRRAAYAGKLTIISEPDTGIYDAMNKGVARVLEDAGPEDVIGMLNADDRYEPGALSTVLELARTRSDVEVFYGDMSLLDEHGAATGRVWRSAKNLTRASFADGMPLEHPTMFVRARTYRRLGLYDVNYRIAADYEFALRLLDEGASMEHSGATLVAFRYGGASTTSEDLSYREALRARVSHGWSPISEWARYYRRRVFARAFAAMRWIPGLPQLQARFGASARPTIRDGDE
jgi:glycosyltransferase involved in cell wall biosynthesis